MRKLFVFFVVSFIFGIFLFPSKNVSKSLDLRPVKSKIAVSKIYGEIPLYFVKNRGQFNSKALFYSRTKDYTLWATENGLVFDKGYKNKDKTGRDVLSINFMKPKKSVKVELGKIEKYRVNYFKGDDRSKWIRGIESSKELNYRGIYKDIDLKVYGNGNLIEYDWVVKRGGNPGDIEFEYKGSHNIKIDREGNIVLKTGFGKIVHKKPYSYQIINNRKIQIKSRYYERGKNRYGIKTGKYDKNYPLIIDPVSLVYSTYLGGSDNDYGFRITVDNQGYAYVTGGTGSTDFPTENPYQTDQTEWDVFVTKLSRDGSSLIYSTYLGGDDVEEGYGITVDSSGYVYVTGGTGSTDFPTENPYQTDQPGYDAFVTKLSPDGGSIVYSTYLGGTDDDNTFGIAVDISGYAYVAGQTESSDFPTENPYQTDQPGYDAFVTKLSPDGGSLVYSTYLGGDDDEISFGIAVDSQGCAYVSGLTLSSDFPTENPYQTHQAGENVFVTKLSQDGSSLAYSTYLGGSGNEDSYGIAVDKEGYAYVIGVTDSSDFPTENPYQTNQPGYDAFVTKLSQNGNYLVYSTYLGGSNNEIGMGIAVDNQGYAYATGFTVSSDFPTKSPYQTYQADIDVFVTKLSRNGNSLIYSTYLGGNALEISNDIAVDSQGYAYVTGYTVSSDFPTQNPYQTNQAGWDAFVTKLSLESDLSIDKTVNNSNPAVDGNISYKIRLTNNGPNDAGSIMAEDDLPSELIYVSSTPSQGTYNFQTGRWNVGSLSNGSAATLTIIVKVNQGGTITNTASIVSSDISDTNQWNDRSRVTITAGYKVDAKVEGGHGSVSPSSQRVNPGGTATINIISDTGYETGSITDNGVLKPVSNPYIIKNVNENHSVVVRFKKMVNLNLTGERKTERAWIIRRDYGKLYLNIEDPGSASSKFVIQRKDNGEGYQDIKSITSSEITGGSYTYYDKYLDKGKTYRYRFIAYDSTGTILAVSNEIEL